MSKSLKGRVHDIKGVNGKVLDQTKDVIYWMVSFKVRKKVFDQIRTNVREHVKNRISEEIVKEKHE